MPYQHLADLVLATHVGVVLFVIGGLAAILIGNRCGWAFVNGWWFRAAHLAAIAFVVLEAAFGMMCPLTVWEDLLRGGVRAESFVGRWVRYFLYYEAPEWVFTAAYVAWTLATLVTLWRVPPRRVGRKAP